MLDSHGCGRLEVNVYVLVVVLHHIQFEVGPVLVGDFQNVEKDPVVAAGLDGAVAAGQGLGGAVSEVECHGDGDAAAVGREYCRASQGAGVGVSGVIVRAWVAQVHQ